MAGSKSVVIDNRFKWDEMTRGMKQFKNKSVEIGIFEGSKKGEFASGSVRPGDEKTLIARYAGIHEFGGGMHPGWHWFQIGVMMAEKEVNDLIVQGVKDVQDGKTTVNRLLDKIGKVVRRNIRKSIKEHRLIDTKAMYNSVRVVKNRKE